MCDVNTKARLRIRARKDFCHFIPLPSNNSNVILLVSRVTQRILLSSDQNGAEELLQY